MNLTHPFFLRLGVAIMLSGCGPDLYIPNMTNITRVQNKGDLEINAGTVLFADMPAFEMQGAYAASDHLVLICNSSLMSIRSGGELRQNHYFVEGGAGYYSTFLPRQYGQDAGHIALITGYGFGKALDHFNGNRYTGRYQRVFLQPSVGLGNSYFNLSFATRFSAVYFSEQRVQ